MAKVWQRHSTSQGPTALLGHGQAHNLYWADVVRDDAMLHSSMLCGFAVLSIKVCWYHLAPTGAAWKQLKLSFGTSRFTCVNTDGESYCFSGGIQNDISATISPQMSTIKMHTSAAPPFSPSFFSLLLLPGPNMIAICLHRAEQGSHPHRRTNSAISDIVQILLWQSLPDWEILGARLLLLLLLPGQGVARYIPGDIPWYCNMRMDHLVTSTNVKQVPAVSGQLNTGPTLWWVGQGRSRQQQKTPSTKRWSQNRTW